MSRPQAVEHSITAQVTLKSHNSQGLGRALRSYFHRSNSSARSWTLVMCSFCYTLKARLVRGFSPVLLAVHRECELGGVATQSPPCKAARKGTTLGKVEGANDHCRDLASREVDNDEIYLEPEPQVDQGFRVDGVRDCVGGFGVWGDCLFRFGAFVGGLAGTAALYASPVIAAILCRTSSMNSKACSAMGPKPLALSRPQAHVLLQVSGTRLACV